MDITFDTINILIALAAVANLLYGFLVYRRNSKSASNAAFFILTTAVAAWGIAMVVFRSMETAQQALTAARFLYAIATFIPASFLLFTLLFPSTRYTLRHTTTALILTSVALVAGSALVPNVLIQSVLLVQGSEPIIVFNTGLHIAYALYIAGVFAAGYVVLTWKYLHSKGELRTQILYILLGTIVPSLVSMFTNLLMPLVGLFNWNWVGQISVVLKTTLITYGILRHRIFDIRVIATEVLIFIVWVVAFLRIVFADNVTSILFNTMAFLVLIIVGVWLTRSVTREVETREKLQELTVKLKKTNERLRELDRQKSEFLSIATHQLRGPLAGIRGHLSLIVDGSYGKIPKQAKEIVEKVFLSSGMLAQTINDFLDVSRIEQGRMQYEKKDFACNELVQDIVDELVPLAKDRGLKLTFEDKCENGCELYADYGKIRHIFFNLIDNAIKYTEKGFVKVILSQDEKDVHVVIKDSGIGIDPSEIDGLFEKFVRARGASGVNVNGTGLGLYVARQMVEAHKGSIRAESEGKGKGTQFHVRIPVRSKKNGDKKA